MSAAQITVGQVWESRDRRDDGRRVVVLRYDGSRVLTKGVMERWMRADTLRSRYRLIEAINPRT